MCVRIGGWIEQPIEGELQRLNATAFLSEESKLLRLVREGLAREKRGSDRTDSADHALAAALFLISLCYAVLAGLLGADCQKAIVGQGAAAAES